MNSTAEAIRDQCRQLAIRDRHHQLLEVLEQVPLETIRSDEDMAFWHALALLSTVRYIQGKEATEEFVRRFSSPDNRLALARSHLLRSHLYIMDGDTEASYNNELKVVTLLPEDAYHERLRSWSTIDTMAGHIGDTERMEQAVEALSDVRNNLPFDQSWWYSFVVPNRADILAKRGFLKEAEKLLLAQLASVPQEEVAIIKLRLAVIALEHQAPAKAQEWLQEIPYNDPTKYWSTEAFLIASSVKRLLGDTDEAIRILQEGIAERAQHQVRADYYRGQMQLCELWIQEGDIELAEAWVSLASKALDPWPRTFGHPIPNLILAQLEMAKGHWPRAIGLLEVLREEGVRRNHNGLLVGIYAHLAYAHAMSGDPDTATGFSQLASSAGAEGNFAKSLTVFGIDVRSYLTESPQQPSTDVRTTVPDAFLLSGRELEVLTLVGEGKRNAEIAASLYISTSTVKNHLAKIFRSLGVSSRREAVHVARQRGILPPVQ